MVGTYIKPFLVVLYSETGFSHTSFHVGGHTMGAFANAAQRLLCPDSLNSLSFLYFSRYTPVTMEFPTDPEISTSVLGFFQTARCIIVGRSSPAGARISAPPDLKKCMVNVVRSPRR